MVFLDAVALSPADEVVLFRSMFRQAGTVMLLIDYDSGRIVGANPAAVRFYGYPAEALAGMPVSRINILPPEIIRQRMAEARARQRGFFQFRHRLACGEIRDVAVYSGPIVVRGHTFLYSIVHDISEEVRLRRERESLAKRLRLAMDVGGVVAWELQEDGMVYVTWPAGQDLPIPTAANPLPLAEVAGWFEEADGAALVEAAHACLLQGQPFRLELRHRQGRWVLCQGLRMEDGDGVRAVGVAHDITPMKAEAEAERARREAAEAVARAREQFLRFLGHEIRTPLSGLLGLLQMATQEEDPAAAAGLVRQAFTCGESLLRLLSDVLDVCRLDAGQLPLVDEPFAPAALCEGQAALFRPQAEAKGVALRLEALVPPAVLVAAPKARLEQIVANLLSNAVKFTDRGEIVLTCRLEDGSGEPWLALEVRDTGCGIPEELRQRLFEPYAQGVLETRLGRGTGLGLAIVQGLARRMGGQVTVESRVGEGSCFRVAVPVRSAAALDSPRACPSPGKAGQSWDILVAEDDPVNQMVLRAMLERLGHRVWVVEDGAAAVAAVGARAFHLALLDVSMPVVDGLEAARRIRELCPDLPLVAVSAYGTPEDQRRFLEVMDFSLPKPVTLEALAAVLDQAAGLAAA